MTRDSFVFYRSFFETAQMMNKSERLRFYDMLAEYALNGVEPEEIKGASGIAFLSSRPSIDANNRRYENGCKGAEYGKLGGRPPKTPKKPQENPKETPYEDVYEDVDEDGEGDDARATPAPCSLDEVRAFSKEIRSRSDPDRFYAYYSARNWTVNGTEVTDWRSLFKIWSARGDHATMFDFPQRSEPVDLGSLAARPGNLI